MDEKIKLYESLLNEKAALEKECFNYSLEYAREFGDDLQALFELKLEVVTFKKKIAFCVKKKYRNEVISSSELDQYIDEEILDYQNRLDELIQYNALARMGKGEPITFEEGKKIKKLYYEIVHLIHPDLHPEYKDDKDISELWDKAVKSYKCNDYKSLVEAYDQIVIKIGNKDIVLENVEGKIEAINSEIAAIKDNEPYIYKFILDDDLEIKGLHEKLSKEIKDYTEYKTKLENDLNSFDIKIEADA